MTRLHLGVMKTSEYTVSTRSAYFSYDGKKLKQGLRKFDGDVDILGFEPGLSLENKRNEL